MINAFHQIDEVIHQKIRLGIMSLLAAHDSAEFVELKEQLQVTDGNLSSHIALLEKNKYLTVHKSFAGKRPLTTLKITKKGRDALAKYFEVIKQILEE